MLVIVKSPEVDTLMLHDVVPPGSFKNKLTGAPIAMDVVVINPFAVIPKAHNLPAESCKMTQLSAAIGSIGVGVGIPLELIPILQQGLDETFTVPLTGCGVVPIGSTRSGREELPTTSKLSVIATGMIG